LAEEESPLPTPRAHRQDRPFALLLATFRQPLEKFFERLEIGSKPIRLTRLHPIPAAAQEHQDRLPDAALAVVDVAVDFGSAVDFCDELRRLCPTLPLAALVCCPASISPRDLRTLFAGGITGVLDLEMTTDEGARALQTIAQGGVVLDLRLRRQECELLREALLESEPRGESTLRLLELVASGFSDREIGQQLYLSPHTIKRHVEQLRHAIGVRNRTELAGWAGRNGFFRSVGTRTATPTTLTTADRSRPRPERVG
jgi:DNA-binding NarL/FixJ family response regulator